jgi:inorganic pyrophosphatase
VRADDELVVTIEIPRGSRNKYEYDPALDAIVLDRRLFTSTVYPADYGFVDGTLAEDGDPLDALVLVGDPTFPGCRIRVRAVAVFRMRDEKGPDDKLICVPLAEPLFRDVRDVGDVLPAFRDEIEHFFRRYKELEAKETETRGFGDAADAERVLAQARDRAGAAP